jgi:hypothetical protein
MKIKGRPKYAGPQVGDVIPRASVTPGMVVWDFEADWSGRPSNRGGYLVLSNYPKNRFIYLSGSNNATVGGQIGTPFKKSGTVTIIKLP